MEHIDDRRPRRLLRASTAVIGRVLGWRHHAPTRFYGLVGSRTVEAVAHVHDSAGDRWRLTLAGDRDDILALVQAVQTIGGRAHALPADELRALAERQASDTVRIAVHKEVTASE